MMSLTVIDNDRSLTLVPWPDRWHACMKRDPCDRDGDSSTQMRCSPRHSRGLAGRASTGLCSTWTRQPCRCLPVLPRLLHRSLGKGPRAASRCYRVSEPPPGGFSTLKFRPLSAATPQVAACDRTSCPVSACKATSPVGRGTSDGAWGYFC
jgi:hypothetical protein